MLMKSEFSSGLFTSETVPSWHKNITAITTTPKLLTDPLDPSSP